MTPITSKHPFQSASNSHLTFKNVMKRSSGKQDIPLKTVQDLQNSLICLYKHARLGVDKKWRSDFEMAIDARAAAGQPLDTGMLPQIFIDNNKLTYTSPKIGKDKICDGNCGKCKAALNFF